MSVLTVRRVAASTALVAAAAGALGAAFAAGVSVGHRGRGAGSPLDQAATAIRAKADHQVSERALEQAAIRGMLGSLDDQWAAYYGVPGDAASSGTLQALLDGRYSGLGVWLRRSGADRQIVVASVSSGSPALAAGLKVGDRVTAVEGRSVAGEDLDSVTAALRGPAGSLVGLTVTAPDGVQRSVRLERRDLPAGDVSTEALGGGLVRIRIAMFSTGTAREVRSAVAAARAAHARGLVLDLRGNPGGLLDEAVASASVFLDGGPVVSLSGRTVPAKVLSAATGQATTLPLAVLVDGGTASAAEILAGALQDRKRAVLVGSRTFGKGSVQQTVQLSDGSGLELTVASYRTPAGHVVDKVGLHPDVAVPAAGDPTVAVDRARSLLAGLAGVGPG
ncbi:MAG TPA: S41 family peptidase [Mycobacteriales bacterium]|nr:S41 family peptidase [Mycobacteriales bacterium]